MDFRRQPLEKKKTPHHLENCDEKKKNAYPVPLQLKAFKKTTRNNICVV